MDLCNRYWTFMDKVNRNNKEKLDAYLDAIKPFIFGMTRHLLLESMLDDSLKETRYVLYDRNYTGELLNWYADNLQFVIEIVFNRVIYSLELVDSEAPEGSRNAQKLVIVCSLGEDGVCNRGDDDFMLSLNWVDIEFMSSALGLFYYGGCRQGTPMLYGGAEVNDFVRNCFIDLFNVANIGSRVVDY